MEYGTLAQGTSSSVGRCREVATLFSISCFQAPCLRKVPDKAKARSKPWEWKAKEGIERITSADKERDEAKEEDQITQLTTVKASDKAWAEDELARVQDALAVVEEARPKAESKVACLEVERTSLLLEIGATKDEVSSLQSQTGREGQRSHGGGLLEGLGGYI